MYNEKQTEYFQKQGQLRLREKQVKEKETLLYKNFAETEQYKRVKAEILEMISKQETFEPTQEGALKALCHNKKVEGLLEFFAIVERKGKV